MADEKKRGDSGLDKRQKQIQVGAGLEEARYNVEFIDFLKKWGPTVLLIIAAASLGWMGLQRWRESRENRLAQAFADLEQASILPLQGLDANPEVLLGIAEEYAGEGAVPVLARLQAAEQWRLSAARGLRVGSQIDRATGKYPAEDSIVRNGDVWKEYLNKARAQYQRVVDETTGDKAKVLFELTGLMGLAAISEVEGKGDEARALYTRAQTAAENANFPEYAALAKKRSESVSQAVTPVVILPESLVMSWDKPAAPAPLPAPGTGVTPPALTPSALSGDLSGGLLVPQAPPAAAPTDPVPAETPPAPVEPKKEDPKP